MAKAAISKELHLKARNETGLLGRILITLALDQVAILHLSAYSEENGFGQLQMITADNAKAKKVLSHFMEGFEEREVLVVEFENKTGTLAPVARLLGSHGISINSVYGTGSDGFKITGVFSTSDNVKALQLINQPG